MMFSIVGYDGPKLIAETRVRPASAALLAQLWQDRGYNRIRVEYDGAAFAPAEFRDRFVLTAAGVKPRATMGDAAPRDVAWQALSAK